MAAEEATRAELVEEVEQLRRKVEQLRRTEGVLHELAISLSATSNLNEAAEALFQAALQLEGVDCGGLYIIDRQSRELVCDHHKGLGDAFMERNRRYDAGSPRAQIVLHGGQIFDRYDRIAPRLDEVDRAEGLRAIAVIPIMYRAEPVACLNLASHSVDEWSESVRNDICSIAAQMGGAIFRVIVEEERWILEAQVQHAQKLESLGVLAGGIAHDFNNLLMGILGNTDLALLDLPTRSPVKENILDIERAARRAAELCRQMLAYSGHGQFLIEPIDLSAMVGEITHLVKVSVSKKAILRYDLTDNLPAVLADATQVHQIIMNLITNASEAIGDTAGVISIATGSMDCDRLYLSDCYLDDNIVEGTYVYFEVSDSGCGMDEKTLARIFDPFFTTKFTGRGLGLSAVLGIIRGHKGAIKVYSEPKKGSTFKVLFPVAEKETVEERSSRAAGEEFEQYKGSGTVLLVEDEEVVCSVGKRMLKKLGFDVLIATNGQEGLELFAKHFDRIRCVILDLTMPQMDGEECFREMCRIDRGVRVILTSGYNEQEVTPRFAGKGLAGFIQKPFTMKALREKLAELLKSGSP